MCTLQIALLQMSSFGYDQAANLAKGAEFCRKARDMGADIALFPEMWNVGYNFFEPEQAGAKEKWLAQAVGPEDEFIAEHRRLAAEMDIAIAVTYLERTEGAPRNTVSLIDRHGVVRLTYAKVHTCDFDLEAHLTPGEQFGVCALDTRLGEVNIGAMICYDREFPESARVLMLQGAEIILVPNACGMTDLRLAQLKTRAYENMVGVALANYPSPFCNGHSIAFDAEAYGVVDGPERNTLIIEAGESEGIYMAAFDPDSIRAYRSRESWGNAYRKPKCYGLIASPAVEAPFIRSDSRRS